MGVMATSDFPGLPSQFRQLLGDCQELYRSSGQLIAHEYPDQLPKSAGHFLQLMDDLHQSLLVKVFVTVCEADRRWSKNERFLGEVLLFHLWGKWLKDKELKASLSHMAEKALLLKWYALVRPFDSIAPLRNRVGELETIVTRLANVVARADGPMRPGEGARVKMIQDELQRHLREIPIDQPDQRMDADKARNKAIEKILHDTDKLPDTRPQATATQADSGKVAVEAATAQQQPQAPPSSAVSLEDALAELDRLIGLANIKHEVRTLTNFIKVQRHREEAGLPTTPLSLHMVFGGNPGTGKTTVARIVGKTFGAMGVLKNGHLVETDRSGLVAEYAGQTGPKTNKKIDEALDGVLFIDEAYALISAEGEDPFGREAVQTLLKRMEDDRARIVVILAGYPVEMQTLLRCNPGLSSRFSRNLDFRDYSSLEMAQIFGVLCDHNHYKLQPHTRVKILIGLDTLYHQRDRHFGNGRLSRNLFEHAIRRMANRIAEIPELSLEQLTTLEATDIEFTNLRAELFENLPEDESLRFHIECPQCDFTKDIAQAYLGQSVRCPKCEHDFSADWGALVKENASGSGSD